ncbi:MAG: glycosyltransferase [Sulfurimonas sp.]|nr:glycosyltransferase [Sulfurimonas sp.]
MKNLNIGILTTGFIGWQGGIDFLKNIIIGLKNISQEEDIYLHLCFEINCNKHIVDDFRNNFQTEEFVFYTQIRELHLNHQLDLLLPSIRIIEPKNSLNWIGYIPDCQHKYLPHFFSQEEISRRDLNFSKMIKMAKLIIVNSIDTKKDLVKFYGAKKNQIVSLPFAPIIESLDYLENNSTLIEKYKLPKHYFVISNQFWLHKDHGTAFKALSLIKNKSIHIVCTGELNDYRSKTYMAELFSLIEGLELKNRIHFLGIIPKIEQIEIIKCSVALIQPTLFEGGPGGGSVYNAISVGKKCIVSNIQINKEIVDNNILFFKAGSHKKLALKMEKLISEDMNLISSDSLIEKQKYFLQLLASSLLKIILSYKLKSENYDKKVYIDEYILFSKQFNNLYNQLKELKCNIVVYGNGTIGKTIQALIPEKIVGYVDIADENNHPRNLENMKYDKIIISVLGREEEIIKNLTKELHIEKEKIITLEI